MKKFTIVVGTGNAGPHHAERLAEAREVLKHSLTGYSLYRGDGGWWGKATFVQEPTITIVIFGTAVMEGAVRRAAAALKKIYGQEEVLLAIEPVERLDFV